MSNPHDSMVSDANFQYLDEKHRLSQHNPQSVPQFIPQPAPQPLPPPKPRGLRSRAKYAITKTFTPLICHFIVTTATIAFLLAYLRNRKFGINSRNRYEDIIQVMGAEVRLPFFKHWIPLQADMITTLSVLLVLGRFFLATWCADVAWKSIFILLEQTGLSITQIRDLIRYKVLMKSGLSRDDLPPSKEVRFGHILVALVLLLPIPAHISAPVITGSITWTPSFDTLPEAPMKGVANFVNSQQWSYYQSDSAYRIDMISQAGRYYNLFYSSALDTSSKRSVTAAAPYALEVGSEVSNITIPFISLSNLTWITSLSDIPPEVQEAARFGSGRLNMTRYNTNVLIKGSFALIPPKLWRPANATAGTPSSPLYEDPAPITLSQKLYVALWPRYKLDEFCNNMFADQPELPIPRSAAWVSFPDDIVCYIFATVDVVAGAGTCNNCPLEKSQIVSTNATYELGKDLLPDPLVNEVLWLMPQVTTQIVQTANFLPTEGSLDDYIKILIKRVYAVSWSALTDFASDEGSELTAGVRAAIPASKAVIDFQRILIWIAFQSLPWFAAILFSIVCRRCKRPMTVDTVLAAMFLDPAPDVQDHARQTGLTEVVVISSRKHNQELGILKLEFDEQTSRSRLVKRKSPASGPEELQPDVEK